MLHCGSCGAENQPGRRFCRDCGAPLPVACPGCGFLNEPADRFCGGCGTAVSAASARPIPPATSTATAAASETSAPERRHISLMFCDLVGSTALATELDPEILREVYRTYQRVAGEAIASMGGYVGRYLGDGILAYFGYPKGYENDAERAVRAGLAVVEGIVALSQDPSRPGGVNYAVRISIATGLAVVGDIIGVGSAAEEKAVVGETPNRAARMQSLARPNTLVVDFNTRRLTQGLFEYQALGEHRLKGFAQPVGAWRVLAPREDADRFEARRAGMLTRLVARERELGSLRAAWREAEGGHGRAVVISAEAGVGKSRLAAALLAEATPQGEGLLRLQCSPFHGHSPLYPVVKRLERMAGIASAEPAATRLTKLALLIDHGSMEHLPCLAELLGIPPEMGYTPAGGSADERLGKTLGAVLSIFERRARQRPQLMLLEDLHWVDPTTGQLIERLLERLEALPMLLVVTSRPEGEPEWIGHPEVQVLRLTRLTPVASAEMVSATLGGKSLPLAVVERIVAKADGVPLFLEELTKTVIESGLLEEGQDAFRLRGALPDIVIPATLQESLLARLGQLSPVKEIAQIASVIGRELGLRVLVAVSGLRESQVEHAIDQLCAAEILIARDTLSATYQFKHALLQAAAYESLLLSTRRELHGRVAEVLEQDHPDVLEREPEVIAHHYTRAGRIAPALRLWGAAGSRALGRAANAEVLAHVAEALALVEQLPPGVERDRVELRFRVLQGAAYRATRGFASPQTEEAFTRARALCDQAGDPQLAMDTLRGLYACYYIRGEIRRARAEAEQVMALVAQHEDGANRMVGHWMLGCILFWQGEITRSAAELEAAVALYQPAAQGLRMLSAQLDPGLSALTHLAWALWMLGYPERSAAVAERAIATARALAQPVGLAQALYWASAIKICAGECVTAAALLPELRMLTTNYKLAYFSALATLNEGLIAIDGGAIAEGLGKVERAFAEFRTSGAGLGRPWAVSLPVATLIAIGETAKARTLLEEGLTIVAKADEHQWEAELLRLSGELCRVEHDPAGAAERYGAALAVARTQGAKTLELRAATGMAQLLAEQGRGEEARALLVPLLDWFDEGHDGVDQRAARRVLAVLPAGVDSGV